MERDFGFPAWEPPDAGENTDPAGFGGGTAGVAKEGFDEDYTRQAERFLAAADLPEPFCLIVSLVNPHDVLGLPLVLCRRAATGASSSPTCPSTCP